VVNSVEQILRPSVPHDHECRRSCTHRQDESANNEISDATYYQWKSKYGGMQASDIKRLRELEDENRRLKQMSADLLLENRALKDVIAKKL
jgi:putative transposase